MSIPLQADPSTIAAGVNNVWMLVVTFLIFFMQPGFALLEAGQVRAKNVGNVLMKNMTDWILGTLIYFVVGAAIATIVGGLTSPGPVSISAAFAYVNDPTAWISWLFGAVFAMTAATIVSGAVAERMEFNAYVLFTVLMTAIIYPVVVGFTWGGGLLSSGGYLGNVLGAGYLDFAGATVVHMCGGVAGLVAAKMVGARKGRYDANGESQPIPGHSMLLAVLGTFILAFGWYGFNVGTQATILSVADDGGLTFMGAALGRVALVTTLGMGAGGAMAMLMSARYQGKPDPLWTANGLLAGLVAVTGAVPHVTWWGGALLGGLGGFLVLPAFRFTVDTLKVDDVCGVFAVHGVAGAVGTALIPVFAVGGFSASQFALQILGVLIIAAWTVTASGIVLYVLDLTVGLRVGETEEAEGLDLGEHGVSVYPEFVADGESPMADGGSSVRTDGGEFVASDGGERE
ncbi:ammonium transporter [Halogeometricum borinquense]|uniref:Ammonium transporter n=1 Tax=Halogeometricum borinquense TaxID=60847 RepID=A0A6C0UGF8_9EURY|nr:ammonium transporter [Halogeometricum borinquense]QIB72859.1 ammonium transporter [Halogeometricum borinquense]QIQ75184.1 ammonium transporter [Halogeometricum borinquense]